MLVFSKLLAYKKNFYGLVFLVRFELVLLPHILQVSVFDLIELLFLGGEDLLFQITLLELLR